MAIWQWSKTANNNATADPTISLPEGMPPSSVNDSARAMMARVAEFRDDRSGMLLDTGTASAYVVTTNEGVQLPTPTDGTAISFIPANNNNSGVTLAVDGSTPFPIQTSSGNAIGAGFMQAGQPYDMVFKTSASAWLIKNLFSVGVSLPNGSVTYAKIQNVTNARLLGNNSGGAAPPQELSVGAGLLLSGTTLSAVTTFFTPNIQIFTSGTSATYTTPTNGGNLPLYLRVRMVGGGGGGAATNTNNGNSGGDSSFASWTALHGAGGTTGGPAGAAGSGGTNGTGTPIRRLAGANGAPGTGTAAGAGGASVFGGAGVDLSFAAGTGVNATANSGSGGAGAAGSSAGGGGAGEYVEFIITSPGASFTYTVGTGGAGGAAGGNAGGNGAAGRIEVEAFWQ